MVLLRENRNERKAKRERKCQTQNNCSSSIIHAPPQRIPCESKMGANTLIPLIWNVFFPFRCCNIFLTHFFQFDRIEKWIIVLLARDGWSATILRSQPRDRNIVYKSYPWQKHCAHTKMRQWSSNLEFGEEGRKKSTRIRANHNMHRNCYRKTLWKIFLLHR